MSISINRGRELSIFLQSNELVVYRAQLCWELVGNQDVGLEGKACVIA